MERILDGILSSSIYGLLGIILMGIGFLVIRLVCPFSLKKEIEVDQNISVGVIIGGIMIGIAIIIAAAIVNLEARVNVTVTDGKSVTTTAGGPHTTVKTNIK